LQKRILKSICLVHQGSGFTDFHIVSFPGIHQKSYATKTLKGQENEDCGTKFIERFFKRPPMNISSNGGFSPRNVQSMVQFAREYPDFEIVKQLVSQIPWKHNIPLL